MPHVINEVLYIVYVRVSHSRLHSNTCRLPSSNIREIVAMEEKFDALIKSMDSLKETQAGDQQDLQKRLDQSDKDVAVGQEAGKKA